MSGARVDPPRATNYAHAVSRGRRAGVWAGLSVLAGAAVFASSASAGDSLLGTSHGVEYWHDGASFGADANGIVLCPDGTRISGGGFTQPAFAGELNDSSPIGKAGWDVNVRFNPSGTMDTFAMCSKGARKFVTETGEIEANETGKLKASCTGGRHVIGGGAAIFGPIADARLNSSYPYDSGDRGKKPDDGWKARGVNLSGAELSFAVTVICAKHQPSYVHESVTIMPASNTAAIPGCPGSKVVLSGGVRFTGPAPEAVVQFLKPTDDDDGGTLPDDGFLANGHNEAGADPKTLTGYAICD